MPTYLIVLLALSVIVAAAFAIVMVRWALQQSNKAQRRRALLDELSQSGRNCRAIGEPANEAWRIRASSNSSCQSELGRARHG
jgi:hypothetical protein